MSERTCPNCRDEKNTLCKGLGGLQPLVCRACGHCFRCADSKPRPWLRAEEVKEPGWYWWRPETITPMTRTKLDVYRVKKSVNAKYISTLIAKHYGQLQEVQFIGGLWQRIPEPEMPEEDR